MQVDLCVYPGMRSNSLCNKPKQRPTFNGLTRQLNKRVLIDGQKDIKPIIEAHVARNQSLNIGSLPKFILKKLPKDNLKNSIKEIYSVFDDVTLDLRDFYAVALKSLDNNLHPRKKVDMFGEETGEIELVYPVPQHIVEKMRSVFLKYKIIQPWDDFNLIYLGKGGKGAAYKIDGVKDWDGFDEDELIMKVFHVLEGDTWHPYKSHGCYAETNSAAYWMKNVGDDTQRGKFFFGSLGSGYIVNKFIDEDIRLPKRVVDQYYYGLKVTDEDAKKKHNVCKGYSYDWGGVRVINRVKNGNKCARKTLERFEEIPDQYKEMDWWRLFNQYNSPSRPNTSRRESITAGLAMGIKYMKDKKTCIDECLRLNLPEVNHALAYVLKYLPYKSATVYFRKLVQKNDPVLQIILFNEIPLLAMKHRDDEIKDDLQTLRSEIIPERVKAYYDIAEKYATEESIEHLASFVHLLPKEDFAKYYHRLVANPNKALHERLDYKRSSIPPEFLRLI